jgi:hypothetical protein
MLTTLAVAAIAVSGSAEDGDEGFYLKDQDDQNMTQGPFWTLDENGTDNVSGMLVTDLLPPYYGNEPFVIGILWSVYNTTADPNLTVTPRVGLDEPGKPKNRTKVTYHSAMDGSPDVDKTTMWFASSRVFPDVSNEAIVGTMVLGDGTIGLRYNITVAPDRVLLSAVVGTPNGTWMGDEQTWAVLPLLLLNEGGAGATDLLVDIHYAGRIIATNQVSLVPPLGNYSLETAILPFYGQDTVEVRLVTGLGAPRLLAQLNITVLPVPILDVVSISATPRTIVTGEEVHIETVVRNRGNGTSTGQLVELMVDGAIVGNGSIEGLGPGNETTVSLRWQLTGEGVHTVSVLAEGDDFAAEPVAVKVKAESPVMGPWAVITALLLASLVARRSVPSGRA